MFKVLLRNLIPLRKMLLVDDDERNKMMTIVQTHSLYTVLAPFIATTTIQTTKTTYNALTFQQQKAYVKCLPQRTTLSPLTFVHCLEDLRLLDPTGFILHSYIERLEPIGREVKTLILESLISGFEKKDEKLYFDNQVEGYRWIAFKNINNNPSPMDYLIAPSIKAGGMVMMLNLLGPMDVFLSFVKEYIIYNAITKNLSLLTRFIERIVCSLPISGNDELAKIVVMLHDIFQYRMTTNSKKLFISPPYWSYYSDGDGDCGDGISVRDGVDDVDGDCDAEVKDDEFVYKKVETLFAVEFEFECADNYGKTVRFSCPSRHLEFVTQLFEKFPESCWPVRVSDLCSKGCYNIENLDFFRGILFRLVRSGASNDFGLLHLITSQHEDCGSPFLAMHSDVKDVEEQKIPSYIPMIEGMLLNLGKGSSSKIHQMLTMFSPDFSLQLEELEEELDKYLLKDEEGLYLGRKN